MTPDSHSQDRHSRRGWIVTIALFVTGVVYLSAFWGSAAAYLPAPLNKWASIYWRVVEPWWMEHVLVSWPVYRRSLLLWAVICMMLGIVVPSILLRLSGRTPADLGMRMPNVLGGRMIIISVVLSIPFGLWLTWTAPDSVSHLLSDFYYRCALTGLIMIPEHFFTCGICVALMLPGRRLPNPTQMAPIEGRLVKKFLRWLGLAQPTDPATHNRLLAWFGLTGTSLFAIFVGGALFAMVHIGVRGLELLLSFPGGVAVAYITLRSQSIWPGLLAHYALNLIPLGLWAVLGAGGPNLPT